MSVNFNELSRTICLLTDSNKELYKYLVLGLDIPTFDFNAQESTAEKILKGTGELDKQFEEQYFVDYGLNPASMTFYLIQNTFTIH